MSVRKTKKAQFHFDRFTGKNALSQQMEQRTAKKEHLLLLKRKREENKLEKEKKL